MSAEGGSGMLPRELTAAVDVSCGSTDECPAGTAGLSFAHAHRLKSRLPSDCIPARHKARTQGAPYTLQALDLRDAGTRRAVVWIAARPFAVLVGFTLSGLVFFPLWLGVPVMLADTRSRLKDYLRFRDCKFSARRARQLGRSWCSRAVAEAIWPEASAYYRRLGYRFWHIFPDGAPMVFFDIRFIRSIIGL